VCAALLDASPVRRSAATEQSAARGNAPGRHNHTVSVGGVTREFIVYVPKKAAGAAAVPVVVMIHGTTGDGDKFFNTSRWREKADAEGLIAVFPTALVHCFHDDVNHDGDFGDQGERQVTTKWSAGALGTDDLPLCTAAELAQVPPARRQAADHPPADDMGFFSALFDFLQKSYVVDAARIYVTGFSNGSQMAGRLAVEMSGRIAAAGAHAGPLAVTGPAARAISVLASFGNRDRGAMFFNKGRPLPMDESILTTPQFKSVLVDCWLAALKLRDTYSYAPGALFKKRTSRFTYAQSQVGAANRLELLFIEGLEHQYPNGTNHPVVMADVLWEFFKDQRLPAGRGGRGEQDEPGARGKTAGRVEATARRD
jgi:polyhydroxybutyrate depolymerase